jgi:hypothetical protein
VKFKKNFFRLAHQKRVDNVRAHCQTEEEAFVKLYDLNTEAYRDHKVWLNKKLFSDLSSNLYFFSMLAIQK